MMDKYHQSSTRSMSGAPTTINEPSFEPTSASKHQPYPSYPLPIPPEKLAKAVKYYNLYRFEEALEESHKDLAVQKHDHLNSRRRTASTVMSSSSTGNEMSAGPGTSRVHSSGLKQRLKTKLSPKIKAKGTLLRHLGSCWVCRNRRVPCPLEHHDLETLETLCQPQQNQCNPNLGSIQNPPLTLYGLGQHLAFKSEFIDHGERMKEDLSNFGGSLDPILRDLLDDPPRQRASCYLELSSAKHSSQAFCDLIYMHEVCCQHRLYYGPPGFLPDAILSDPYSTFQNGEPIALGVARNGRFLCQHLHRICQDGFDSPEALQTHFERAHFPVTCSEPAQYPICSKCYSLNDSIGDTCSNCGFCATLELWIYGKFIRSPTYGTSITMRDHFSDSTSSTTQPSYEPHRASSPDLPDTTTVISSAETSSLDSGPICHTRLGCFSLMLVMIGFIGMSCFLGTFFTIHKEYGYSMGDAFTLAGFVIGIGTLVCSFMFAYHYPRCNCWIKKKAGRSHESQDAIPLRDLTWVRDSNEGTIRHDAHPE